MTWLLNLIKSPTVRKIGSVLVIALILVALGRWIYREQQSAALDKELYDANIKLIQQNAENAVTHAQNEFITKAYEESKVRADDAEKKAQFLEKYAKELEGEYDKQKAVIARSQAKLNESLKRRPIVIDPNRKYTKQEILKGYEEAMKP